MGTVSAKPVKDESGKESVQSSKGRTWYTIAVVAGAAVVAVAVVAGVVAMAAFQGANADEQEDDYDDSALEGKGEAQCGVCVPTETMILLFIRSVWGSKCGK